MKNLLLVKSDLKDLEIFENSINQETILVKDIFLDDFLSLIDNTTKHIGFVYHFQGYPSIEYFNEIDLSDIEYNNDNYIFIQKSFRNMLTEVKKINPNIIFDLLTCNVNDNNFINELFRLTNNYGFIFRYSTNEKGYGGDWIQESHNISIKDIYFTDNINNWKHVLTESRSISYMASNYPDFFELSGSTLLLKKNLNWSSSLYSDISLNTDFITLSEGEIFDGQNNTITVLSDLTQNFRGLFASDATSIINRPIIRNLNVLQNKTLDTFAGIIVRATQKFLEVHDCSSSGFLVTQSGGICGYRFGYQGDCLITNCYSYVSFPASPSNSAGGICGSYAGNDGNCSIFNCYSFNSAGINTPESGGICGGFTGIQGNCSISNCYTTSYTTGTGSGGICGRSTGNCTITNCYSTGSIGSTTGGICGDGTGTSLSTCIISNCYSTGNIQSHGGGICARFTSSSSGNTIVSNCYSIGTISSGGGGIFGRYSGWNNGTYTLNNSVSRAPFVSTVDISGTFIDNGNNSTNISDIYNNNSYIFDTLGWSSSVWRGIINNYPRLILNFQVNTSENLSNNNLSEVSLVNKNLSNVNLSNTNLTNVNFTNSNLTSVNLTNAITNGITLIGTTLTNVNLSNRDLSNTNLAGSILINTNLSNTNLTNSNLSNIDLSSSILTNSILINSNLTNSKLNNLNLANFNLTDVNFTNADLTNVDLSNSILDRIILVGTILTNVNLSNRDLSNTNLSGAKLINTNLSNTNLTNSNLSNIDLSSSNLTNSILINSDLTNSNLTNVDLTNLPLDGAILISTNLTNVNLSNRNLSNTNLSNSILQNTNFSNTNLTNVDLSNSDINNIILIGANLTNVNLSNRDLSGYDLTNTTLINTNLSNTNLTNVNLLNSNLTGSILTNSITGPLLNTTNIALSPNYFVVNNYIIGNDVNINSRNTGVTFLVEVDNNEIIDINNLVLGTNLLGISETEKYTELIKIYNILKVPYNKVNVKNLKKNGYFINLSDPTINIPDISNNEYIYLLNPPDIDISLNINNKFIANIRKSGSNYIINNVNYNENQKVYIENYRLITGSFFIEKPNIVNQINSFINNQTITIKYVDNLNINGSIANNPITTIDASVNYLLYTGFRGGIIKFSLNSNITNFTEDPIFLEFDLPNITNTTKTLKLYKIVNDELLIDSNYPVNVTYSDNKWIAKITTLSDFIIVDDNSPTTILGGDPFIKSIKDNKVILLPNSWKKVILYQSDKYKVVGYNEKLKVNQMIKMKTIKYNQIYDIEKMETNIYNFNYLLKLEVIDLENNSISILDTFEGKILENNNINIEEISTKNGLNSVDKNFYYPKKNFKAFMINLDKGNYITIKIDNYWIDLNNIKLYPNEINNISGELIVHNINNKIIN